MLEPRAAGEDVEGDVQDVVGLVVGQMALEQMEVVVDVARSVRVLRASRSMAPMPPAPRPWTRSADLVVDIGGGDHGPFAFGAGPVLDAAEDSPLASAELVEDIGVHSKASWWRTDEACEVPRLFAKTRGFSSLPTSIGPG